MFGNVFNNLIKPTNWENLVGEIGTNVQHLQMTPVRCYEEESAHQQNE